MITTSSITNDTLAQILGTQPCNVKRDPISKYPFMVNGHFENDTLVPLPSPRSKYDKNLIEFVKDVSLCFIDVENTRSLTSKDCLPLKNLTHKDHWNNRLKMYEEEQLVLIKKTKPRKEKNWGKGEKINGFLNDILQISEPIANKVKCIIEKFDPNEIEYRMHSLQDIYEILELTENIFKECTLLNELFNTKDDGLGKGEVLISFLLKSCVSGTSKNYDILVYDGKKIEVKSPFSATSSFRFGTKGGIGNYKFFTFIIDTRTVLRMLTAQIGKESFKSLVSKELYELSMLLLKTGNFTIEKDALSSAIDSAEINADRFMLIELWFCLAHIETTNMNLTRSIKQDIFTKEYEANLAEMKFIFRSIPYVENPLRLIRDIDSEIKKCFKGIDYLVVFKEKEKNISICSSASEITMSEISQNGIKVIEKKHREKKDNVMEVFRMWKEDNTINFYETFRKIQCDINTPIPTNCCV